MDPKIRDLFVSEHEKYGLSLESESEWRLIFNKAGVHSKWVIDEEDIKGYIEDFPKLSGYVSALNECSLVSGDYLECRVRDLTASRVFIYSIDEELTIGDPTDTKPLIKIGLATRLYKNRFRFTPYVMEALLQFSERRSVLRREFLVRDRLPRFLTIKISRLAQSSAEAATKMGNDLINAALFQVAALRDRSYLIADEWPVRRRQILQAENDDEPMSLPRATFRGELISFYKLAVASESPELKFLAFYQVLEFFYLSVSDQVLYERLASKIVGFDFKPNPANLDRLIQDVLAHRRESDETAMLRMVLQKFVDANELIDWIASHEKKLGEKSFTRKQKAFGGELQITLSSEHVFHTTAKYIKTIRNAIVHSSDRHERTERHIPFSQTTDVIHSCIPLIRQLAERVIYASADVE